MFNVGDEVRVIADPPSHGWGSVTQEETGIIREIKVTGGYWVDFPRHPYWNAKLNDLELVNREPDWEV